MEIISNSSRETQNLGKLLGQHAFKGMIITLKGEVGAGKTEFTKGFTMGVNSDIAVSPTFAIMNVYEGAFIPVYHFDLYRCRDDWEEFEEYIFGDGVAIIEWSEYLDINEDRLEVCIEKTDDTVRKLTFSGTNERYNNILKEAYYEYFGR